MKALPSLVLALVFVTASGCGTFMNHQGKGVKVYGGVQLDVSFIADGAHDPGGLPPGWMFFVIGVIDLPFSLVGDTLCLPYDVSAP